MHTTARTERGRPVLPALGTLAGIAGAGLAWSLAEAQAFTVRRLRLPVLPPGSQELRILHLSDLHLRPGQNRKIAWVRRLAELEPDLVVDTGDNMAHVRALPAVLRALDPLLSRPGAFVMGSNDYFTPQMKNPARYLRRDPRRSTRPDRPEDLPGPELGRAFAAAGWLDLTNRSGTIEVRGTRLEFIGVDDPHLERDVLPDTWLEQDPRPAGGPLRADPAVPSASPGGGSDAREPGRPGTLRIGVTHAPYQRVLAGMQSLGCRAVLAGHTHGGQLCIPGYGALVTNCDLDRARASGLHGWPGDSGEDPGAMWLHVSNGVGTSPFTPLRFACRPSVTLLTLTAG